MSLAYCHNSCRIRSFLGMYLVNIQVYTENRIKRIVDYQTSYKFLIFREY